MRVLQVCVGSSSLIVVALEGVPWLWPSPAWLMNLMLCMQLEQHLSSRDSRIGAVHLGMQLAGDSLILQWSHSVDAAIDPGIP